MMTAEIYWVSDLKTGGLAILGRPRPEDWLDDEIAGWKSANVTDVVSLLEDHEIRELGLEREEATARRVGLTFERFPIRDRDVPASIDATHALWSRLAGEVRRGRRVGIHCRAGIGRSGLMVAGVLVHLGVSAGEAWKRIAAARRVSVPDTERQREWLREAFCGGPNGAVRV